MQIKFIVEDGYENTYPKPVPSSQRHPEWFKKLRGFWPSLDPTVWPLATAKRCVPFLDATSAGYMLGLPCAVRAQVLEDDRVFFSARDNNQVPIGNHFIEQVSGSGIQHLYKWLSPWGVEMPEGWSLLYTHPMNYHDLPFKSFSGIVDHGYKSPVQIPFAWTAGVGEYYLDANTPIAQLIPIRCEEWEASIVPTSTREVTSDGLKAVTHMDGYRTLFHTPKVYK